METGKAGPLGLLTRETRELSCSTGKITVCLFIFICTGKTTNLVLAVCKTMQMLIDNIKAGGVIKFSLSLCSSFKFMFLTLC